MVYNEIKPGDISCLSFLKGTKYALYVGPELNEVKREQLKLQTLPFHVLYLPEILDQLSDAVVQYNFPGVSVPESFSVKGIYAQIIDKLGNEITSENRLIIRYVDDALVVFDAKRSFSLLMSYLLYLRDQHAELISTRKRSRPIWKSPRIPRFMMDFFDDLNEDRPLNKEYEFNHEMRQALLDVKEVIDDLILKGCPPEIFLKMINQSVRLSRLKITKQFKIFLTDYDNMEIKMGPLPKTLFIFFLRHPEGVMYSHLQDHIDEIRMIYGHLSTNDDPEKMEESVIRLVDPFDNSINEKCASVKKAFVLKIADDIAANYYIAGEQGKHKRISLDRSLVDWECELQ